MIALSFGSIVPPVIVFLIGLVRGSCESHGRFSSSRLAGWLLWLCTCANLNFLLVIELLSETSLTCTSTDFLPSVARAEIVVFVCGSYGN